MLLYNPLKYLTKETVVTFATSDVGKLNSIKDFIRSLNVSIIQEEDIPQPIEMTLRLVDFLNKIEAHNTPSRNVKILM